MGFEIKKAKKALKKANNDLDSALDILNKEELLGIELVKSGSSQLDDTKNALIKMMLYICKQIEEANRKCLICQSILAEPSVKVRPCTS
jgi:hypothetical protein